MKSFRYLNIIVNRNMVWGSLHGEQKRIKDMEDTYLVNLYYYLERLGKRGMEVYLREVILELMDERGIDINKYSGPVPYKINGEWMYEGLPATEEQVLCYKLGLPVPKRVNNEGFKERV